MAEDEESQIFEMGEKSQATKKPQQRQRRPYEECNVRLDELSKPRKWYLLSTYQENLHRFDGNRLDMIRAKIQEEFSLTPEETEKYMEQFKRKVRIDVRKRELVKEIKKQKKMAQKKAYMVFRKYIKRGMMYACQHSPPTIVSPVVNAVSDALLKILAEIHNVPVPKRHDNDKIAQFLTANAEWLAIAICSIYYDVEIELRKEIQAQVELERQLAIEKKQVKPLANVDDELGTEKEFEFILDGTKDTSKAEEMEGDDEKPGDLMDTADVDVEDYE